MLNAEKELINRSINHTNSLKRKENANDCRADSFVEVEPHPLEDEQLGIFFILQALTICDFIDSWDKFRLLGEKPPANRRGVSSTPTQTAFSELHSTILLQNASTRGSRAAKLSIVCVPKYLSPTCHVSFFPTRTKIKNSLSPILSTPIFPTFSLSHTSPLILNT